MSRLGHKEFKTLSGLLSPNPAQHYIGSCQLTSAAHLSLFSRPNRLTNNHIYSWINLAARVVQGVSATPPKLNSLAVPAFLEGNIATGIPYARVSGAFLLHYYILLLAALGQNLSAKNV